MTFPLIASAFAQTAYMLLLGAVALFLILLVLVQRGRGGGLAGALGGVGGSSAFGAKAGDVFTKITIGVATVWIVLCIAGAWMTTEPESLLNTKVTNTSSSSADGSAADGPSMGAPAGTSDEGSATNEGSATEEDGEAASKETSESTESK